MKRIGISTCKCRSLLEDSMFLYPCSVEIKAPRMALWQDWQTEDGMMALKSVVALHTRVIAPTLFYLDKFMIALTFLRPPSTSSAESTLA